MTRPDQRDNFDSIPTWWAPAVAAPVGLALTVIGDGVIVPRRAASAGATSTPSKQSREQ